MILVLRLMFRHVGLVGTDGDNIVFCINDSCFKVDVLAWRVVIWGSAIWPCLYRVGFGSWVSVALSGS